jgi:hypothetical protein
MYRWETAAHLSIKSDEAKGVPSDLDTALAAAQATQTIRNLNCKAKKRTCARASV